MHSLEGYQQLNLIFLALRADYSSYLKSVTVKSLGC